MCLYFGSDLEDAETAVWIDVALTVDVDGRHGVHGVLLLSALSPDHLHLDADHPETTGSGVLPLVWLGSRCQTAVVRFSQTR